MKTYRMTWFKWAKVTGLDVGFRPTFMVPNYWNNGGVFASNLGAWECLDPRGTNSDGTVK